MLMQVTPPPGMTSVPQTVVVEQQMTKYQWYKEAKAKLKYDYDWAQRLIKTNCRVTSPLSGTDDLTYLSKFVNLYQHFMGESLYAADQCGKWYRVLLAPAVFKAKTAMAKACKQCCGVQGVSSRFQSMAR